MSMHVYPFIVCVISGYEHTTLYAISNPPDVASQGIGLPNSLKIRICSCLNAVFVIRFSPPLLSLLFAVQIPGFGLYKLWELVLYPYFTQTAPQVQPLGIMGWDGVLETIGSCFLIIFVLLSQVSYVASRLISSFLEEVGIDG